jgi:magnesium-protoporphyrin IX monomethyl ester (oxidative) cyclase
MAEIDHLKKTYGEDVVIQFEDDNILIRKDRAKELFQKLATQKVKWAIHSGVMIKLLDEELIMRMKKSGCEQLNLALESGNPTVLKAMDKQLDLNHAANVVRWCKKHHVNMLAFLIVGYPGETDKTWAETLTTLRKLKKLGLRQVAPFIVNAHPGTPLYEDAVKNGWLRNAAEAVYNGNLIQIETEDFNEAKVRQWYASVEEVMHPYKFVIKRTLKFLLSQSIYDGLIDVIRQLRFASVASA